MSSGAELSVIAVPVGAVAVGALALTAGAVVIGGVALVGVGRLGVAAGSYVMDRLHERARTCADEYVQYQRARARLKAAAERHEHAIQPLPPPRPIATSERAYHEDSVIAEMIAARMSAEIEQQQARFAEQLQLVEQRARLRATLNLYRDALPPSVLDSAECSLQQRSVAPIVAALDAVRGAIGQANRGLVHQLRADLRDQYADFSGLLTLVADTAAGRAIREWQQQLSILFTSNDIDAMRRRLREGQARYVQLRQHLEAELEEQRTAALALVWGKLQSVGALISDLKTLEAVDFVSGAARYAERLQSLSQRFEAVAGATTEDAAARRLQMAELEQSLDQLEAEALAQLTAAHQDRLTAEVEQGLRDMKTDGYAWDRIDRTVAADGTVVIKARQQMGQTERKLDLRVRPDGQLKYHAYGFGDEGCLDAVYSLLDRMMINGVQLHIEDPELNQQVEVALRVGEALKQLGYAEEQITVREGPLNLVIEASKGAGLGFQRRIVVDAQGNVQEQSQQPAVSLPRFIESLAPDRAQPIARAADEAVAQRKATQKAKANHRNKRRLDQRQGGSVR